MNRRFFLALLGATATVAAVAKGKDCAASVTVGTAPGGLCFPVDARREPAARPRTAAIIYLTLES